MSQAKPKADETYTYTGTEPLGSDSGALAPGEKVTVRELVGADVKGAHDNSEDAVVVAWDSPALVRDENGVASLGTAPRAVSIGLSAFHDSFKKEG